MSAEYPPIVFQELSSCLLNGRILIFCAIRSPDTHCIGQGMAEIGLILQIAELLQLTNTVLTSCWQYVLNVKNAPADINKVINEVSGLESLFKQLSTLTSTGENDPRMASLKALYASPAGPFHACTASLSEMVKKLEKISGGNVVRRRLMWPFESGKLEELLNGLEKHKSTIMLALTGDSVEIHMETNEAVKKIGIQMDDLKVREERERISQWLRGVDPSTNHNAAEKARACHGRLVIGAERI